MDGQIRAESVAGSGSTFEFELPLRVGECPELPRPLQGIDIHFSGNRPWLQAALRSQILSMGGTVNANKTGRIIELSESTIAALGLPLRSARLAAKLLYATHLREQVAVAAPRDISGLRVLLAEDNVVNQKIAVRLLERLGCDVTLATNGREAVAASLRGDYDIILMDCQMPEMDGYQAAAAIRETERPGSHIPILALTAHALDGER